MENPLQENRVFWFDNLRAIATIAVIILHVSAVPIQQYGSISTYSWWVANAFDSCVRFCVPIFVMLTGALLLPREYKISEFLKKKLVRVVLPFIFWSFVYIIFSLSIRFFDGESLTLHDMAKHTYLSIKQGSSYHFWYIYMIIGLYLFIPIIGKWVRNSSEKEILYFLGIWLITLFISQPLISKLYINVDLSYFSGFLGYLVLGYYLSIKTFKNQKIATIISVAMVLAGIIATALGTYIISLWKGEFNSTFYVYMTPNIMMISAGVFLFIKNHEIANKTIKNILGFISKFSYGIYLVHVLIITVLSRLGIQWDFINPLMAIPLATVICLCISVLIVFLINKLPLGKYISG